MIKLILLLMVCHWMADFTQLSNPWMLAAKQRGKSLFPILAHACVHGVLMFIVLLFFTDLEKALTLMAFQIAAHFCIDVWKGRMNGWFPKFENTSNPYFWWLFGFDQFLHQVVILSMVFWVYPI